MADTLERQIYSKARVEYTDDGSKEEHCSICFHYIDERTCEIVQGAIKPGGWCNKFAHN